MPIYTPEDWDKVTGKSPAEVAVKIRSQLVIYHTNAKTVHHGGMRHVQSDANFVALDKIYWACFDWLKVNSSTHDLYGPVYMVGTSVLRRLKLLQQYRGYVTQQRDYYAKNKPTDLTNMDPSHPDYWNYFLARTQGLTGLSTDRDTRLYNQYRSEGTDPLLQLSFREDLVTVDFLKTGGSNYWLERADPLHRPWGHTGAKLFEEWRKNLREVDFFTWIEDNKAELLKRFGTGAAEFDPQIEQILEMDRGVKYIDKEEKWRYRVGVVDGKLVRRNPKSYDGRGATPFKTFETCDLQTVTFGQGWAIWVASPPTKSKKSDAPRAKFYSHRHKLDRFHHSSFLQGGDVLAAGEWAVVEGRILCICNKTGHYQAGPAHLVRALQELQAAGLDLKGTVVLSLVYGSGRYPLFNYAFAEEFLKGNGNASQVKWFAKMDINLGEDDHVRAEIDKHITARKFWLNPTVLLTGRRKRAYAVGNRTEGSALKFQIDPLGAIPVQQNWQKAVAPKGGSGNLLGANRPPLQLGSALQNFVLKKK